MILNLEQAIAEANAEPEINKLDLHAIMLANESKKRCLFDVAREGVQVSGVLDGRLPKPAECFKVISGRFGFSSAALIDYIARQEPIEILHAATFRIGKKQMAALDDLHTAGLLGDAVFVTSQLNTRDDDKYNYYQLCAATCQKNGWKLFARANHAKIILAKTKNNHYVVETSSNLNENPKIEQFSIENDAELYRFYKKFFDEMG